MTSRGLDKQETIKRAIPHMATLMRATCYRVRLWKIELQKLADELKFPITACHLPPGTSKWNKIEHRLFSFISINWRGKPLRSFRTIVELIAATTTETGLTVRAELNEKKYPKGLKVSDAPSICFLMTFMGNGTTQYLRTGSAPEKLTKLFLNEPLGHGFTRTEP
jgi:hypothetical protein